MNSHYVGKDGKKEMDKTKIEMPIFQQPSFSHYYGQQYTSIRPNFAFLTPGNRIPTFPKQETIVTKPIPTTTTTNKTVSTTTAPTTDTTNTTASKSSNLYQQVLKPLVFEFLSDLPNSLIGAGCSPTTADKRIQKDMSIFKDVLPCQSSNAIFVRVNNTRMYSMNILISGSTDTPYSNGLYHFQLFCDFCYPVSPPKMQMLTGKGKVRFNPNLYQNGKICLSLLGTWQGSDCQVWCPVKSNLNQIFLSIQSLIMSNDIYYNEPGYKDYKGTKQGEKYNRGYGLVVKLANIRYAMIEIIKKPPVGFEEVVRKHFLLKKEEILEECQKWLKEKDQPYLEPRFNLTHEQNIRTNGFKNLLEKEIQELKIAFATLTEQK